MLYSIIDKMKGESSGMAPALHQTYEDKMVVNENELRLVNSDIAVAAEMLGGTLMTQAEVINELKKRFV